MNFEIKNRFSGNIIFRLECESLKFCIEAAIKSGADLSEADLYKANLQGVHLRRTDMREANLCRSNLCRSNLSEAYLREVNLQGADLSRANLFGADLFGADLRKADLRGVNLCDANLYEANLGGANLYGANLSGAGIPYASCCWSAHGECGRELLGVVIDNTPVYFCGCFCGREEELRKYIADGKKEYKVSRTIAADFVSQRIKEMMNRGGGLDGAEHARSSTKCSNKRGVQAPL